MKTLFILTLILLSGCARKWRYSFPQTQEKMKICVLGDTGTGGPLQAAVAEALAKEECHSVHFVGDIIYSKGLSSINDPQLESKFFKFYRPVMEGKNRPRLVMLMGNHDHQGEVDVWQELSQKNTQIFFPNPYFFIDMQGLCFVHLDTNLMRIGLLFPKALAQLQWLSGLKNELANCGIRVALTHHPFKNRGTRHGPATGTVKWFLSSQVIGQFDFLVSGHEHILSDEGLEEGTHMFISGAGGNTYKGEDSGFLVLEAEFYKGRIKSVLPKFIRTVPSSPQTSSP